MNCSLCYHRLFSLAKGNMKAGMSPQTQRDTAEREITENNSDTSHCSQIENATLDTPLALADTIETMADSHIDHEVSVVLVDTSRPSNSIETDREISDQLYQHENTDHLDTPPTRDNSENKDTTLDAPLADTQTAEVTIERGTDIENAEIINTETQFIRAVDDVDMTSSETQALPIPITPIASSTPIKPSGSGKIDSSTSPMIKSFSTFSHSLSLSVDHPLSKEEESLNTHLVRRKLHTGSLKKTIKCKTRGQPIVLQKVVAPRKATDLARTPTKRKRVKLVEDVRSTVAGTSKDSEDTQVALELRRFPSGRRIDICKKAGVKQKLKLSGEQTLTMKEELGMSWRQGRKHRRLLKGLGVQLQSEHWVRRISKELVSYFVRVEKKTFLDEEGNEFQETYGRIKGLNRLIDRLLDLYDAKNMLTWHSNSIPDSEIWVKIGADHGRSSLKFTLQIANTQKPNSQQNTIVIALASVRDSYENIARFLEGGFGDELAALHSHMWREKTIQIFLNGEYDFLCKVYGLSGPQGTFPCLWCLMPRRSMHSKDKVHYSKRTLNTLFSDNAAYQTQSGEKTQVARYNNCKHPPLIKVELNKVAPPYLHILLGVVLKHHKHLEEAAHAIDVKITKQEDKNLTELGKTVKTYGAKWQQAQILIEKLQTEQGCFVFSERGADRDRHWEEVENTENALSQIEGAELTFRSGPVASSLDPILTKHRITPQAYHSRSFVGNHCHKYMKPHGYEELTTTITSRTQACTYDPFLVDEAFTLKLKFDQLNYAYAQVHRHISHTNSVMEQSVTDIQALIDNYMTTYRRQFPNKTIPKQHILEYHCTPHILQYRLGLGLLGEQGTEASHQTIAQLEKFRASAILNSESKMEHILSSHLLNILSRLTVDST